MCGASCMRTGTLQMRALVQVGKVQVLIAHDVPWYEANKGGPAFLPGVIPALV